MSKQALVCLFVSNKSKALCVLDGLHKLRSQNLHTTVLRQIKNIVAGMSYGQKVVSTAVWLDRDLNLKRKGSNPSCCTFINPLKRRLRETTLQ